MQQHHSQTQATAAHSTGCRVKGEKGRGRSVRPATEGQQAWRSSVQAWPFKPFKQA
jgi:hypothetical protein